MSVMDKAIKDMMVCLCDEALSRLNSETSDRVWSWFSSEVSTLARQSRDKDLAIACAKAAFTRTLVTACLETGIEEQMKKHFDGEISEKPSLLANYLQLFRFVEEARLSALFDIDGRLEVNRLADRLEEGKYLVLIPSGEREDFLRCVALQLHASYLEEDEHLKLIIRDYLVNVQSDMKIIEDASTFSKSIDDLIYELHKIAVKWPKE